MAGSSLKLRRPDPSSIKILPIICPGCSQTSPLLVPGPGMVIQEGPSGKHGSLLGPYILHLHKSGLWKESFSLNSEGLSLSVYSPVLAPAYALEQLCGGLSQRHSSRRTAVLFWGASTQLTVLTCGFLCHHKERHRARKETSQEMQDCLSQQQHRLKAYIKPWPRAIPVSGLCFVQQQEGFANANIHILGFFF